MLFSNGHGLTAVLYLYEWKICMYVMLKGRVNAWAGVAAATQYWLAFRLKSELQAFRPLLGHVVLGEGLFHRDII